MNVMYYKNIRILNWEGKNTTTTAKLEDASIIPIKTLIKPDFEIECKICHRKKKINFYSGLNKREYWCMSCRGKSRPRSRHSPETIEKMKASKIGKYIGENNPFYGRHHSENTKKLISNKMTGKYCGENAPFYGKRHTDEVIKSTTLKIKAWRESLSPENKNILSKKISDGQKKLRSDDPQLYRQLKQKAAKASCLSIKRYKKNRIEEIVENKFKEMGLNPKYSVILGYHQYDFGFKNERILLEVNGDYWHSNPKIYNIEKINYIQRKNLEKDKVKQQFAKKHNFKLYYIWENDINNNNFEVLEKIKNEIQTNCAQG